MPVTIAIDPGLAAGAWVAFETRPTRRGDAWVATHDVLDCHTWRTKPRKRTPKTEDDRRRLTEVLDSLADARSRFAPDAYAIEAFQAARSYRAGRCHGLLFAAAVCLSIADEAPLFIATVQGVKVALAGDRKADKNDMVAGARALYPELEGLTEHEADAIGVFRAVVPRLRDHFGRRWPERGASVAP